MSSTIVNGSCNITMKDNNHSAVQVFILVDKILTVYYSLFCVIGMKFSFFLIKKADTFLDCDITLVIVVPIEGDSHNFSADD